MGHGRKLAVLGGNTEPLIIFRKMHKYVYILKKKIFKHIHIYISIYIYVYIYTWRERENRNKSIL